MPCKKHHSQREVVHGRTKMVRLGNKKRGELIRTATGIESERTMFPCVLVIVKTGEYDLRRDFFRFCKRHALTWKVVEGEIPKEGEAWPWSLAFEVAGGPALEKLCCCVPPSFVIRWEYVVDTGVPRMGMSSGHRTDPRVPAVLKKQESPVIPHKKKPWKRERVWDRDEVARWEYDLKERVVEKNGVKMTVEDLERGEARRLCFPVKWEDLSPDQQEGLGSKDMVVKLEVHEVRYFLKDRMVLHAWMLGAAKPMRWNDSDGVWVGCN